MRALLREIHDPGRGWHGTLIGLELRIEQGGELRETQLFRDRQALEARNQDIYDVLIEKGWKPAQ